MACGYTPAVRGHRLVVDQLNHQDPCLVESTARYAFMARGRYCSLPKGHEGQHIAYSRHQVTGHGADVIWLGPWVDDRAWQGAETDRLQSEWENRLQEEGNE